MKRRRLLPPVIVLVALVVVLVFFTDLIDVASFLPKIRLQRTETISSSAVTLQAVRELATFNTVEYVQRTVFPYDYLPEDFSRDAILAPTRIATGPLAESLSPEQLLHFNAYNLAVDVGLSPEIRQEFVVVTVVIIAGFELENLEMETGILTLPASDGQGRRARVTMPKATVTDIRVEDIVSDEYSYPDVSIGADDWRRIADFVSAEAQNRAEMEEVLRAARENGEQLVREVLLSAGFDEVEFAEPGVGSAAEE